MTWIRVESNAAADEKWKRVGKILGLSADECFGKMVRLWGRVAEKEPEGDLGGVSDATLEEWAYWRGKPGRFAKAFRSECLTDGKLDSWEKMQGQLVAKAKAERERKAASRKVRGHDGTFRGLSADTVPSPSSSKVNRDIQEKKKVSPQEFVHGLSADIPHYDDTLVRLPETARPAFEGLVRAAHNPVALVGEVWGILEGMHGPATPEAVGVALRDLSLGGGRVSGKALRGFVRGAMNGESTSAVESGNRWKIEHERAKQEESRATG